MADLSTVEAINLFEICQRVAARIRVDDEDDRHDFALTVFERWFTEEREPSQDHMWAYAQASISGLVKNKRRKESRMIRESMCLHEDGESYFELHLPTVGANQETVVDANFWQRCVADLPEWHRDTMRELADGGSALSLCTTRDIRPNDALKLAKHARDQVREIAAQRQLERARWPNGVRCAHCESSDVAWSKEARRYHCSDCGERFGVASRTLLSRFLAPWNETNLARFYAPCSKICEAIEVLRDGGGASELEAQFGVPYLTAFEMCNAVRDTDWAATIAGLVVKPSVEDEPKQPAKTKVVSRWGVGEIEMLRSMIAEGQTPSDIAEKLTDRSVQAIYEQTRRLGLATKKRAIPDVVVSKVGAWEDEEIAFLKTAWAADYTATEIAAELGRSRNSVLGKIHRYRLMRIEAA